jgi:hypothetical protein
MVSQVKQLERKYMRDQSNATLLRENKKPSEAPSTEGTQKVFYAAILGGSSARQTYISFCLLSTPVVKKNLLFVEAISKMMACQNTLVMPADFKRASRAKTPQFWIPDRSIRK